MRVSGGPAALVALLIVAGAVGACSRDTETLKQRHLAEGNRLAAQGQYREAIVEYRNALKADERFGEARFALAEAYSQLGETRTAYREYVRAADLMPGSVEAQVKAGTILLLAGRFEDARARADTALAADPKSVEAQVLRANAMAGLKDIDGAVRQIEEAIRLDPKQAAPYANLGALELARGNRDEAEQAFRQAVDAEPQSVVAHLALANFYWSSGRQGDAESSFREALRLDPSNVLANRALATFYLASGRAAEAEPHLKAVADPAKDAGPHLALADYYLLTGRTDEAEKVLTRAANLPGGHAPARSRIAALRFGANEKALAYATIDDVLKKEPTYPQALMVKTRFLLLDGKLDEALQLAREATAADPGLAEAHYLLGLVHARRAEVDEAIAAFTEVLRLNPKAAAAQLEVSRLELQRGGAGAAVKAAQDAVTLSGNSPVARLVLARAQMAAGEIAAAEAGMQKLLAEFPRAAPVQAQSGTLSLVKRDYKGARLAFARALELDPDSTEAIVGLVSTDMAEGRVAEARARIDARLQQRPDDPTMLMLGARVYGAGRDFARAEQWLRRAIEVDPSQIGAYTMLGQIFIAQRKLAQARAEFETLAGKRPTSVPAHTMVAMLLQAEGRTAEAQQRYEQVVAMDPRAAVAANNLAWIYAEQGQNLDTALNLAQAAKAELPEVAEVSDTLGYVYYQKQLYSLAIPAFEAAVRQAPANPDYHFRLGLACAKAGEWEKGKRALREALRLKPDFPGAAEARRTLSQMGG